MAEDRRLSGKVDEPLQFVTREEFRDFRWKVQQALATLAELEVSQGGSPSPRVRIQELGELAEVLKGLSQNLDQLTKVIARLRAKDLDGKVDETYGEENPEGEPAA